MLKAVSFCPVTCLPSLVIKKSGDDSQKLKDCFCFDEEVKPGWIQYDPKKITVLSCNDSFSPLGEVSAIVNVHKQMISVKNEANMKDLSNILEKPILMCVTRRHQFGSTTKTASSDSVENFLQKELTSINGFDIDFAVIFPPEVLRDKINESLKTMKRKVLKGKKFCIMIDIKRILQELTPTNLQDKDSLEYVSWHNTAFWLTNHSKPFHSLTLALQANSSVNVSRHSRRPTYDAEVYSRKRRHGSSACLVPGKAVPRCLQEKLQTFFCFCNKGF
ncbi:unnamed protein product [Pocillopora meandrina]|uniref:Uncharacterized protein n=1 Tax=Pocillopora meandrina TaxID=46732 RepID=A0AAU9WJI6_9CNID|nr:unnamed protein product [Pocillopora meandrina]